MLKTRVIAAAVFTPAILAAVYFGGLPLKITCLSLGIVMMWEFLRMALGPKNHGIKVITYILGGVIALAILGILPMRLLPMLLPGGIMVLAIAVLVKPHPIDVALHRATAMALAVLYGACLIPYLSVLREGPMGLGLALCALFCTWGGDTGAYFSGRAFGKHKLYADVSPNKTIEGAVGGVLTAIIAAFIIRFIFPGALHIGTLHVVGVAVSAAIMGAIGDLCESLFKRSAGIKDASNIIPGHGGVLDRFDAVMFAAPAVYIYATIFLGYGPAEF